MSWGTRRRNTVVFLVIIFLLLPIIVGAFLVFYEPPSCFDGKQNSKESGIDCGGNCDLVCTSETLPPVVVWQRFFRIEGNTYNALAYIENPNPSAGIKSFKYKFKLYNRSNIAIAERSGIVRLYPKSILPILETNINTVNQIPERITFEIDENYLFEKEEARSNILFIQDESFREAPNPRVNATVKNLSLKIVNDIEIIVLLYDALDNVIGSSSTFVDRIVGEGSEDIVFTWPSQFQEDITRIEIVPIYSN
jgi:hypothetical protein